MGRHQAARREPVPATGTFWGVLRLVVRLPAGVLLLLVAVLVGLGILAVQVGDAYGDTWGALISAGVAPIIGSLLLRAAMASHDRGRFR
jgi:hypothetical protein